jgi:hypothetical protein
VNPHLQQLLRGAFRLSRLFAVLGAWFGLFLIWKPLAALPVLLFVAYLIGDDLDGKNDNLL